MSVRDRVNFAHSISYPENDNVPGVVRYFDEVMWLYGVAANLDYTVISIDNVNNITCFNIQFMTELQLNKLVENLASVGDIVNVYGIPFHVSLTKLTDTSMSVSVNQCA